MLTIVETPTFLRCAGAIWADDKLMEFKVWLAGHALLGDVIPSVVLHTVRYIKPRLFIHGGVANPRNSRAIAVVCALP